MAPTIEEQVRTAVIEALKNKTSPEVKVAQPPVFKGDVNKTTDFVDAVQDYIYANESRFETDKKKIIYMKSFMLEGPRDWARTKTDAYIADNNTWEPFGDFLKDFLKVYAPPNEANRARIGLGKLRQKDLRPATVTTLNSRFRTLMYQAGLKKDDSAIVSLYKKALKKEILYEVLRREKLPTNLDEWMDKAQEVDGRMLEYDDLIHDRAGAWSYTTGATKGSQDYGEPMDIDVDAITFTPQRRSNYNNNNSSGPKRCYNCDGVGHLSRNCPSPRRQGGPRPQGNSRPPVRDGYRSNNWRPQGQQGGQAKPPTNAQQVRATHVEEPVEKPDAFEQIFALLSSADEDTRARMIELTKDF